MPGLLLAAQEPLHLRSIWALLGRDDEDVREGLERLGGLLSRDGEGRFTLFHLKLRDFLRDDPSQPERAALLPADEEERWHLHLAEWAEGGAPDSWGEMMVVVVWIKSLLVQKSHYFLE